MPTFRVCQTLAVLGYAESEVAERLRADSPREVFLPNRFDTPALEEQFAAAHSEMLRIGAVAEWPFPGTRPLLVLPCSAAVSSAGKFRPIFDARDLNLFLRHRSFRYETLSDLVAPLTHNVRR